MDKVIYQKKNVKQIQVNEQGDYIEIDLMDIELPFKVQNTRNELIRQTKIFKNRCKALEKQYKNNQDLLRVNQYKAEIDFCNKCREVLDNLLGKDACLKIFGETNRYGMFDDWFEQFAPVLDNLQVDIETIKDNLINKYKENKDIIKWYILQK